MRLSVNKLSKVPLYLQLRDSVKYYISTGEFQYNQQLPTINQVAKELGVNFETVRKAYKELEREELLSTKRGLGTFVNGRIASQALVSPNSHSKSSLAESAKHALSQWLQSGATREEIKLWVDQLTEHPPRGNQKRYVLFAECNTLQAGEISRELHKHLQIEVRPVLIKDLKEHFNRAPSTDPKLLAVITTGFHLNEVRRILVDRPVKTEFVITNMSPETRRKVEAFPKTSRFAFICRDPGSIGLYRDTLKAELQLSSDLPCCTVGEKDKVAAALRSADVLLVTPGAYNKVRKMAPPKQPVFNVIDRVDPVSLQIVKQRVLGSSEQRHTS
jgi:DNA-binding transcriptional regulator YhcF (GntR family)